MSGVEICILQIEQRYDCILRQVRGLPVGEKWDCKSG